MAAKPGFVEAKRKQVSGRAPRPPTLRLALTRVRSSQIPKHESHNEQRNHRDPGQPEAPPRAVDPRRFGRPPPYEREHQPCQQYGGPDDNCRAFELDDGLLRHSGDIPRYCRYACAPSRLSPEHAWRRPRPMESQGQQADRPENQEREQQHVCLGHRGVTRRPSTGPPQVRRHVDVLSDHLRGACFRRSTTSLANPSNRLSASSIAPASLAILTPHRRTEARDSRNPRPDMVGVLRKWKRKNRSCHQSNPGIKQAAVSDSVESSHASNALYPDGHAKPILKAVVNAEL